MKKIRIKNNIYIYIILKIKKIYVFLSFIIKDKII